jgi:transposase
MKHTIYKFKTIKLIKKLLTFLLFVGLFYGCVNRPHIEQLETFKSHVNLMKKDKNSYVSEIMQDSLKFILRDIEYQNSKFILFRSYKKIEVRLKNLNNDIGIGKYKPEKFKKDQVYLEKYLTESREIKYRKLDTGDFIVKIYIVSIDGKEYIYSFNPGWGFFTVTPKN